MLPPREEMVAATLGRDAAYEGLFYTGVRTTGIFCRPTCPAKKPDPRNVEFFGSAKEALFSGYRPCKRCTPLENAGEAPSWLRPLLAEVESDPSQRLRDADLVALGLSPERVRRWFQKNHGMTFQAYARARRLALALGRIQEGDSVTGAAFDQGYESLSGFHEAFQKLVGRPPTRARGQKLLVMERFPTALGPMVACSSDEALYLLEFADRRMLEAQIRVLVRRTGATILPGSNGLITGLRRELDEYFAGSRRAFTVGFEAPGSELQKCVWSRLREIPYGERTTYGQLATEVGRSRAARAVARAVGDNRLAILVPCHRVVGADGRLTGYGGGLWRKERLLDLESVSGASVSAGDPRAARTASRREA